MKLGNNRSSSGNEKWINNGINKAKYQQASKCQ